MLYVGIAGLFFFLISKGRKKSLSFGICAVMITAVHVVLLLSLGFGEARASSKKVGFEAWVCGRQIGILEQEGLQRLVDGDGKAYFGGGGFLVVPGAESSFGVLAKLKVAGLGLDGSYKEIGLPVSKEFELKSKASSSPAWLSGAVNYSGFNGTAMVSVKDGAVDCPYVSNEAWNVFVARVDNKNKSYSWQKVELGDLAKLKVRGSDGDDLPDCVVMDYGEVKLKAEYRCGYLLKNDSKRCAKADKSGCEFREVSLQSGTEANGQ